MLFKVLNELKNSEDYMSGETLSKKFNVTRSAVWKAISSLRNKGYNINSIKNKGYKLIESPDIISSYEINEKLTADGYKNNIYIYKTIDSTNKAAKINADNNASDKSVFISEIQTDGKGRIDRKWISESEKGLYFSILLKPKLKIADISKITLIAAVAVCHTLRESYGLDIFIKWPNDIVINGKKICGILTEMSMQSDFINYIVIGIGINLNNKIINSEIENRATSLFLESNILHTRSSIFAEIINNFDDYYEKYFINNTDGFTDAFNSYCINIGKTVVASYKNKEITGTALGINNKGELIVKTDNEEVFISSGEVSLRGKDSYV